MRTQNTTTQYLWYIMTEVFPAMIFIHGTYTKGMPFKAEFPISNRDCPFCLPSDKSIKHIAAYEYVIDEMVHFTLEKCVDKHRLSPRSMSLFSLDTFLSVTRKYTNYRYARAMCMAAVPQNSSKEHIGTNTV